jgi:hypothetical protein
MRGLASQIGCHGAPKAGYMRMQAYTAMVSLSKQARIKHRAVAQPPKYYRARYWSRGSPAMQLMWEIMVIGCCSWSWAKGRGTREGSARGVGLDGIQRFAPSMSRCNGAQHGQSRHWRTWPVAELIFKLVADMAVLVKETNLTSWSAMVGTRSTSLNANSVCITCCDRARDACRVPTANLIERKSATPSKAETRDEHASWSEPAALEVHVSLDDTA